MADRRLTVGGLFSGIGGWELGLERAGMEIAWHCESDPFCRRVLAKHWPDVPCYEDVCALTGADVSPVDVLCGGFPCQDISLAGKGAGIDGSRSGLWSEYARLIGELRPRYVCVENVSALLGRGLDRVLADLAALGFDAEWDCIPASAVGAPHQRDRVWIVAYSHGTSQPSHAFNAESGRGQLVSEREGDPRGQRPMADAERSGLQGRSGGGEPREGWTPGEPPGLGKGSGGQWLTEPNVGRVANGVPARVDRLRSLGNALVPQVAEWIGERIVSYESSTVALDV